MTGAIIDSFFLRFKYKKHLALQNTFSEDIHYADFNDMLIRYQLKGNSKRTLVFVPDPPNTIEHNNILTNILAKDFSVLTFEFPGFGFSLPKSMDYRFTLEDGIKVTLKLLSYLNISSCSLAFPCVSAYVAFKVADLRPDLVKHVVAIQVPSWEEEFQWSKKVDFKGLIKTPFLGQLILSVQKRAISKQWYNAAFPKDKYQPAFYDICNHNMNKGSNFCLASAFQSLFNNTKPQFNLIKQPGIIVWGDKDRTHKNTNKQSTKYFFENSETFSFKNSGHFPELEQANEFAELVKEKIL